MKADEMARLKALWEEVPLGPWKVELVKGSGRDPAITSPYWPRIALVKERINAG